MITEDYQVKIVFKNEPDKGWVTRVQARDMVRVEIKRTRFRIGGLDFNINALDELLNNILFSKLDVSLIKFEPE